ncbi:LysR family transcriptional regulator [Pseudomonas sp. Bout1]|uniref:LysR family transcriptional regulator n=1 Tax=Pseudomonas sp. Bout1 TaxID=3048600 RepID=UPI002AB5A542|nr:LysR family transcriptional regulator [Pseudomonas sp. Bout1]MDY7532513.1 LysR family transcriptional regulator [Pseudomonas sp. Bout1]MEB0186281.1 LysR family transcriptional regulator [Pseudomonas sp. Bout1]
MINPLHFDLLSLRLLIFAAETANLTRAAEKANMTVSTASKRLAELERTTECPLFVRLPRGLELTAAGQGMVEHAKIILAGVNRMACDASDYAVGVRGHVRLFANTSAVVQFLPDDLAAFLQDNPHVRIGLEEALSEPIIQAVESGRADIGIFADNVPAQGLYTLPYREDRLVLLVPVGHALATARRVSFSDTLGFDYVALNQGSSLLRRITDAAASAGKVLKVRIQVSSFDGICRMIEAGLGIGILPLLSVRAELLGSRLIAVELDDDWAQRTLFVGVSNQAQLAPEAAKLFAYLSRGNP